MQLLRTPQDVIAEDLIGLLHNEAAAQRCAFDIMEALDAADYVVRRKRKTANKAVAREFRVMTLIVLQAAIAAAIIFGSIASLPS